MKKKKIFISGSNSRSLRIFRYELIKELVKTDYEVHIFLPDNNIDLQNEFKEVGVICHRSMGYLSNNIKRKFLEPLSVIRILCKVRPELTLTYNFKAIFYVFLATLFVRVNSKNIIITGLGKLFKGSNLLQKIIKTIYKSTYVIIMRRSKNIFFQNIDDISEFNKYINSNKIFLVNGSGINLNEYKIDDYDNNKSALTFLMLSRYIRDKGLNEYLDAAKQIINSGKEIKFIIAGEGGFDTSLDKKINSYHKKGYVENLGFVKDVKSLIKKSSVLVLPSYYREGVPRSLIEGLAMGKPIITTNLVGTREVLISEENGFFVKPKSSSDLICAMEKFFFDSSLIPKMGKKSRNIAEEKFDVFKVNEIILANLSK